MIKYGRKISNIMSDHTPQINMLSTLSFKPELLLETIPGAIIFLDERGVILYINARAARIMGATEHELLGTILWQSVPHLIVTPLYHAIDTATHTDQPHSIIYLCPRTCTPFHVSLSPLNKGTVLFFQKEMDAISWREAYHDRERQYQILLENIADCVVALTPQGLILDINQHPLRKTQIRREDVLGIPFHLLPFWQHTPAAQHQLRAAIEQARQGEFVSFEAQIHPNEDMEMTLAITLSPHLDEHQHVEYIICVGQDITEWTQREQRKDDFLSMLSHELRTPLTSLKLQTQLLKKKLKKHENTLITGPLSLMETQINAVIRLVEDLLDPSKIQTDALHYTEEIVYLDEVLREKVAIVQQMQNTHKIVMNNCMTPSPVIGDRDRLGQVILNLINNAIKYSLNANMIEMKMVTSAEAVTMSVRDQGIGIPLEEQEKIFERFHRAVTPGKTPIPGLGMGLYIALEIVKHHQGSITVESTPGKGSTFHVTLPLHHR